MSLSNRSLSICAVICSCLTAVNVSFAVENNPGNAKDTTTLRPVALSSANDSLSKDPYENYLPKWYDMITRIPGDWVEYTEQTFQAKNMPGLFVVAGATASLMVVDRQWYWTESKWYSESPAFHTFSNWMVFTGDGRFQFGIVGVFGAYGYAFDDTRSLRTASELTEAILACGGVVQLLKHVTGRESPFVSTERTGDWVFFPNQIQYAKHTPHYDAFPSGHLATATATLVVIAENYPDAYWLKPFGYLSLAAISSSLVAYGVHWWSDYPLALVLGYSFGEIASHPLGLMLGARHNDESPKLSFSPAISRNGVGCGLSLSF